MKIVDKIGEPEVLAQLAEEAAELAQAALKLRRAITGVNPTPLSEEDCRHHVTEEIADVELCLALLNLSTKEERAAQSSIINRKLNRWMRRLEKGCRDAG